MENNKKIDGYISQIYVDGKRYAFQCMPVESHAIQCKHCGAPIKLKYGEGTCPYCDTHYTTQFIVEEG